MTFAALTLHEADQFAELHEVFEVGRKIVREIELEGRSLQVRRSTAMKDDQHPLTRLEARTRVRAAVEGSGLLQPRSLQFLSEKGILATDPDMIEMRIRVTVKGTTEDEIRDAIEKLAAILNGIEGVEHAGLVGEREGHAQPGWRPTLVYFSTERGP